MLEPYCAHPGHICAGTALASATSAPGLGPPRPHLRRDCARLCHISTGTGWRGGRPLQIGIPVGHIAQSAGCCRLPCCGLSEHPQSTPEYPRLPCCGLALRLLLRVRHPIRGCALRGAGWCCRRQRRSRERRRYHAPTAARHRSQPPRRFAAAVVRLRARSLPAAPRSGAYPRALTRRRLSGANAIIPYICTADTGHAAPAAQCAR